MGRGGRGIRYSSSLALVASVAAAVASCTLSTDLGSLSGGPNGTDASSVDGALAEASTPDDGSGGGVDGGADAADGADGDARTSNARFCDSIDGGRVFCEDFDPPSLLNSWNATTDTGGVLVLDDASAASPPTSLRTTMPPVTGTCRYSYERHQLSRSYTSTATLDIDLRLGQASGGGGFGSRISTTALGIHGPAANSTCSYYLQFDTANAALQVEPASDSTQSASYQLGSTVPQGQWTHVTIVVNSAAGAAATVAVSFDGTIVLAPHVIGPTLCGFGSLDFVSVGLFCINNNPADLELRTDNVLIRTQ